MESNGEKKEYVYRNDNSEMSTYTKEEPTLNEVVSLYEDTLGNDVVGGWWEHFKVRVVTFYAKGIKRLVGEVYIYCKKTRRVSVLQHKILRYLVKEGYIQGYVYYQQFHDEPRVPSVSLEDSHFDDSKTDGTRLYKKYFSGGSGFTEEEAIKKAVGEYMERTSLFFYRESKMRKGTWRSLSNSFSLSKYVDPDSFSVQSAEIKSFSLRDEKFLWVCGRSLVRDKKFWVPAQLVYLNYNFDHKTWKERKIREPNSNAAAAGSSLESAIMNGVHEAIERDSLLLYWLNGIAPPRVENDSIKDVRLRRLLQMCNQYLLDVTFLNTTTDIGVPSCVCVVKDTTDVGPKISVGARSGRSWNNILYDALAEALASRARVRRIRRHTSSDTIVESQKHSLSESDKRVLFWADSVNEHKFDFFLSGTEHDWLTLKNMPMFLNDSDNLHHLKQFLGKKLENSKEIIYVHAQSEPARRTRMHAVKVLIPSLQYFTVNEDAEYNKKRTKKFLSTTGVSSSQRIMLPVPLS